MSNDYNARTLEDIIKAFVDDGERVVLHNGKLVGFEH